MFVARSAIEILDEIRRIKGLDSDAAVGKLFGVSQASVSLWRSRDSLPFKKIIAFCLREGISTDSLLLAQGPARISKDEIGEDRRPITVTVEIDDLFTTRLMHELGERTVLWLAVESGLDMTSIEDIISGRLPTIDELESISGALQVCMSLLVQRSSSPSENWAYEFYKQGDKSVFPAEIFKAYLVAAENCIEKMQGLVRLSPDLKAHVIATACRVHMKETPNSTEINPDLIRFLVILPR